MIWWAAHRAGAATNSSTPIHQSTQSIQRKTNFCFYLIDGWCELGAAANSTKQLHQINQQIKIILIWLDWLVCCLSWLFAVPPGLPALIHKSTNQFKQIKLNLIWLIDVDFEWLAHPPLLYWLRSARHMPQRGPTGRQLFLYFFSSPIRKSELERNKESWMAGPVNKLNIHKSKKFLSLFHV